MIVEKLTDILTVAVIGTRGHYVNTLKKMVLQAFFSKGSGHEFYIEPFGCLNCSLAGEIAPTRVLLLLRCRAYKYSMVPQCSFSLYLFLLSVCFCSLYLQSVSYTPGNHLSHHSLSPSLSLSLSLCDLKQWSSFRDLLSSPTSSKRRDGAAPPSFSSSVSPSTVRRRVQPLGRSSCS